MIIPNDLGPIKDSKCDENARYKEILPYCKAASKEVRKHIRYALNKLGDPYLVRAHIDSCRVKEIDSIQRKAKDNKWSFPQALSNLNDLVGFRVVCHNLQDVERAASQLEKCLKGKGLSANCQDYQKSPKHSGYRGIHLNFQLTVDLGSMKEVIGCEVQFRSLLENAWAKLSRADIYNSEVVYDDTLLHRMKRLSEMLQVADNMADDIRVEISQPQKGKDPRVKGGIDPSTIAFLFNQKFGEDPPVYLVNAIAQEFEGASIRFDTLKTALSDTKLADKLQSTYEKIFGYEASPEQIFRWIVEAVLKGKTVAVKLARAEARSDFEETDTIYRRHVLDELPSNWRDLANMLEHPGKDDDYSHDILQWARVLDGLGECGICGTEIVDPDALASALVDHYKLSGTTAEKAQEAFSSAISNSGVEVGDWDSSGLCSYHGEVMRRDD